MPQADFAYASPANDAAGLPLAISIFADRARLRDQMRDDAEAAGLRIADVSDVASLLHGDARPLGELVLLDCPQVDGAMLAALSRLDMRAARGGSQLVVSTTIDALDDVFACVDQSNPEILVDPARAERVIALGRALGKISHLRVRELSQEDRLVLLRLSEQVDQIAARLEVSYTGVATSEGVFRFEAPHVAFASQAEDSSERLVRAARPSLPDPRLVRRIVRQRQLRARFFDGELFADPAWDILLDLTAARAEHQRVSVTSLCIASGVPPTTALRWIGQLTELGLLQRVEDDADRRRTFIALTDPAADAMARYFVEIGRGAVRVS